MVPVTLADKVPLSGPADKPTSHQGTAQEYLTHTQNVMLCEDIMDEVRNTVVGCDENGSQGPTQDRTTCFSAFCSLRGLDPPVDLATAISGLVSKNARYQRKVRFNCAGCSLILKNTSFCQCGLQQDYPALFF